MRETPESIESYLSQIERELRDSPSQARAEELREIELHLRAMITARGDVAATLAQFGAPLKVGRDLRRAWERKQPESWMRGAVASTMAYLFVCGHNYFWFSPQRSIGSSLDFQIFFPNGYLP